MNVRISALVIFAHLFFVAASLYLHPIQPKKKPNAKVVVQMVSLPTSLASNTRESPPPSAPATAPLPTSNPPQKKPTPNNLTKKKPEAPPLSKVSSPLPATSEKKSLDQQNKQNLLALMNKSLETINHAVSTSVVPPQTNIQKMGSLASEAISFERNYFEELVCYLQQRLTLPEKGVVKVALTLKRSGKVEELQILNYSTTANRDYVNNTLPNFSFPSFGTQLKGESSHTFSITLTSENL